MVMESREEQVHSPEALGQDVGSRTNGQYELLHKAGVYEVIGNLFARCGAQSNIIVCAKYAHNSSSLTPAKTYQVLARLIDEHPALSIIGVSQDSEKLKGNYRLWEVRLPFINLEECVEFITEKIDNDADLAQLYARCHNQWFDTEDKTKPWWKVLIVSGTWVLFIYHHNIGDGTSGYAFHRSFLAALNEIEQSLTINTIEEPPTTIPSSAKPPQPTATTDVSLKISWFHLLKSYLVPNHLRLLVKRKYTIFSDAIPPKTAPRLDDPFDTSTATVTRVQLLRISNVVMKKCLPACRTHNTTFTALLHTLIQATLATDLYPLAKLSFSRLAISIRPFLLSKPGPDVFTNAASMYYLPCRLSKFRSCGLAPNSNAFVRNYQVSSKQVWKLARVYKEGVSKVASAEGHALQDFMSGTFLGEDDEEVVRRYGMGIFQGNSFEISNLGVFDPVKEGEMVEDATGKEGEMAAVGNAKGKGKCKEKEIGRWSIADVAFSAAAIKAGLCDFPVAFNVASTKGGDCVIAVSYEKGVLGDEAVRALLRGVEERLRSLLDC